MKIKKVYLGRKQIYPDGWSPGENTYAYYPLIANANDTSGNNRNLTADSSITYSEQNGAFLPNSRHTGMLEPFNISTTSQRTFSRWQKTLGLAGQSDARGIDIAGSSGGSSRICTLRSSNTQQLMYNSSSTPVVSVSASANTRHLYTITIGANRQIKFYTDGVLKNTGTVNNFTSGYFRWGQEHNNAAQRQLYGYLKDIIIEPKERTEQEINDYYELTKSSYGL